jgi:hypothetical protein
MRELAANGATGFAGAAAGDDLNASQALSVGAAQKADQRLIGALHGHPVEIERSFGDELSCPQSLPRSAIKPSGLTANFERWRRRPMRTWRQPNDHISTAAFVR